jgi:hypothetical protein
LAVGTLVVDADDEGGEQRVQFRKRQFRHARGTVLRQTPRQLRQKLGVDGAE